MLLNNEPANERIAFDNGDRSAMTKPYAHLKIDQNRRDVFARDLLVSLQWFDHISTHNRNRSFIEIIAFEHPHTY